MEPVHILAHVQTSDPERVRSGTTLVFESIRTGFPESLIWVEGNNLTPEWSAVVQEAALRSGARFVNGPATSHDAWVERQIRGHVAPFWICDGDVVFHGRMDEHGGGAEFAGRWTPEFDEEWTGVRHVERLHTACMWIDPTMVRLGMRRVMAQVPELWRNQWHFGFVRQTYVPRREPEGTERVERLESSGWKPQGGLFYDTCAGLWQAGMGRAFTSEANKMWDHLNCGTYVEDLPKDMRESMTAAHQMAAAGELDEATVAKLREGQKRYYEARGVSPHFCSPGSQTKDAGLTPSQD